MSRRRRRHRREDEATEEASEIEQKELQRVASFYKGEKEKKENEKLKKEHAKEMSCPHNVIQTEWGRTPKDLSKKECDHKNDSECEHYKKAFDGKKLCYHPDSYASECRFRIK